jgi:hypothetical protein
LDQLQFLLHPLEIFLQFGVSRYAVSPGVFFQLEFIFAGSVDPLVIGRFAGAAQFAQDVAGGLFKFIQRGKAIDRHKEVPDLEMLGFALVVELEQLVKEGAALRAGRKDLGDSRKP